MQRLGIAIAGLICCDAMAQSSFEWLPMNAPTAVSADGTVIVGYRSGGRAVRWTRDAGEESLKPLSVIAISNVLALSGDGRVAVGWSAHWTGDFRPVRWVLNAQPEELPLPEGTNCPLSFGTKATWDGAIVYGSLAIDGCEGLSYRAWVWDAQSGTRYFNPVPTMQAGWTIQCNESGSQVFTEGRYCAGGAGLSAYRSGLLDPATDSFVSFAAPAGFTVFSGLYASRDLSAAAGWAMVDGVDDHVAYIHRPPASFRRVCAASGGGGLLHPFLGAVGTDGAWAAGFGSPDGTSNAAEAFYWTPERGMFQLADYLRNTGAAVPPGVTLRSVVDASADGLVLVGESDAGAWIARLQPVSTCRFDLNFDGVVDDADFTRFVVAYNNVFDAYADANQDCITDDADFSPFAVAYDTLLCP